MPFFSGLVLGLAMILPIGPQNVFVLTNGLLGGIRRGLLAAAVAGICDTTLILLGAAGVSAVLAGLPWLRAALLWLGTLFLLYLGFKSFRNPVQTARVRGEADHQGIGAARTTGGVILTGIGVSWGNPHAILDTVAVLGSAIAAQDPAYRMAFAAGTVSASWLFFLTLALTGSVFAARITPGTQVWIRRASGAIMLAFAVFLGWEALGR